MISIISQIKILKYITPDRLAFLSVLIFSITMLLLLTVEKKSDWAIVVASGIGVSGILFNNAVKLHMESVNRSFDFFLNVEERIRDSFYNSYNHFLEIGGLDYENAQRIFTSKKNEDLIFCEEFKTTVNWIETIALSIQFNETDDDLTQAHYGGVLIDYFNLIEKALPYLRGQENMRSPYFESTNIKFLLEFETMTRRWKKKRAGHFGA